jgi:putative ABC transport system permease protein
VSTLERKLGRDLWRLKGQVATIALVLACGILSMVMLRSTWHSLLGARDDYYERYRFADVFAHVERAPFAAVARLERLPGVAIVDPRIVENVMVPLPGEPDPVTGKIVSIPDQGAPKLDDLYLRTGRMPEGIDEAVILEQFATAQGIVPGDRIPVLINARLRSIRVTGIAISPEYVMALSGLEMIPDNRRFVVLWMRESAIAPAFQMEGAFNDVAVHVQPGASVPGVLDAIDRELARYGGRHAIPRDKQLSNHALTGELSILRTMAVLIPGIFLVVAAFLVNVIVSRLVYLERTQIAVLKALGFSNLRIGLQYVALVALIVGIGAVLGVASGMRVGHWMTNLYNDFYRFPNGIYRVEPGVIALTVGVGFGAALVGAFGAVRRVVGMPPAQAMRPPAPLAYRRSLLERLGLGRMIGPSAMMVVREIERRPVRFAMSSLGIALGVSIFVMGRFSYDSFDHLMDEVFPREHQEDLGVVLAQSQPERAIYELEHVPGVELAEPVRVVPVRIQAATRWRDTTITGLRADGTLRHLLDAGRTPVELPPSGLVVTDKLAELLGVRVGDLVEIDVLEGTFRSYRFPIAGLIDEAFGLQAYARADWLARELGQQPRASMVLLQIDRARGDQVRARIKQLPQVLAVTATSHVVELYRAQTGRVMLVMTFLLTLSAAAISIGVVYNNARIAVSMRGRDLATLRVLGFTRREISRVLLGELGAQAVIGIPLGLVIGTGLARFLITQIDAETVRFPLHISDHTYVAAALVAALSALVSALLVRRKLDRLDLIGVLKSSE